MAVILMELVLEIFLELVLLFVLPVYILALALP